MQNNNTLDNDYNIIRILGEGSFSKVFLITKRNDSNNQYASRIRNTNEYNREINQDEKFNFEHELQMTKIASGLNNPNIIHLIGHGSGTLVEEGTVYNRVNYMILEYCSRGNLRDYIEKGRFSEKHAKYIFKKILLGVQALHGAGYCHRKLKPKCILLDNNFNPKISNFILATQFLKNNQFILLKDIVGTKLDISPQLLESKPYGMDKSDILSLGLILFQLVTGIYGLKRGALKDDSYNKYIKLEKFNEYWANLPVEIKNIDFSDEFKDLYIKMICYNENDRPNIPQILNHHWLDEISNLDSEQLNQLELDVRNDFLSRVN